MDPVQALRSEQSIPALTVDHRGTITFVNDPFLRVFGWSREEIVGRPLTTIIPPNLQDAHNLGFSRFLTTGKSTILDRPLRLRAVNCRGEIFEADHLIHAGQEGGSPIFGATIQPVDQAP